MRLVRVIIPLVLIVSMIEIVGVQESFAQYMGNIGNGDEFEYTLEEALEIQKQIIEDAKVNPPIGSPAKQLESGIAPEDIVCKEGLELIFKHDNSPACVKPATAERLIQRGWIVKELNTSSCIDIVAEREKTGIPFELPSTLPNNLKLTHVEKYHFSDIVILSFSSDDCGVRTNLFDGELEVRASLRTEIPDETEFENFTKTWILNLPRNDHYEFFKISGHFAWGYEPIIDSYPGMVSFIGKDVSTFYTLQGHYVLDDLKIIAESFR